MADTGRTIKDPEIEAVFNMVRFHWNIPGMDGLYDPSEIRRWVRDIQDNPNSKVDAHKDFANRVCAQMIDAAEAAESYFANNGSIEDEIEAVCAAQIKDQAG